jgi:REP element-mobilizing transposase RayT
MIATGQISFDDFRLTTGHGGPRKGAGRPAVDRPIVHHIKRPDIPTDGPVHITLRVQKDVPSLRLKRFADEFRRSLRQVIERGDFRVVLYSVQSHHVHMIVEAAEKDALGRGMKAVACRLARAANRVFGRSGPVMDGRYHLRVLGSPCEVRNAIAYVLCNARKHWRERWGQAPPVRIDATSSGRWFGGWLREAPRDDESPGLCEVSPARSWLLRTGWKYWGLIDPAEVPGARKRSPG